MRGPQYSIFPARCTPLYQLRRCQTPYPVRRTLDRFGHIGAAAAPRAGQAPERGEIGAYLDALPCSAAERCTACWPVQNAVILQPAALYPEQPCHADVHQNGTHRDMLEYKSAELRGHPSSGALSSEAIAGGRSGETGTVRSVGS